MRQGYLDDVNTELRCIRIGGRIVSSRAARQLLALPNTTRSRDINVDIFLIFGIDHQRVGVGPTAGLYCGNLLWVRQSADIEDAHTPEPVRVGGWKRASRALRFDSGYGRRPRRQRRRNITSGKRYALRTAVETSINRLGRHEKQMTIHGHVSLTARTDQRSHQLDLGGV